MKLIDRLRKEPEQRAWDPFTLPWWELGNFMPLNTTWGNQPSEAIGANFTGYVNSAYRSNGVVWACILARLLVFSEARFQFQSRRGGRPGPMFGNADLSILENPWPNGTTGELLARMEQDTSLAGNAFLVREPMAFRNQERITRLNPEYVSIVLSSNKHDAEVVGYAYTDTASGDEVMFPVDEVAHWSPLPDPLASYRGMSWLTPVVRNVQAHNAATTHKIKFFDHGAPQPLTARILTPTGWTTMGDVQVGDRVIGSDGKGHEVMAVYPQGERTIYRVTFRGGATVECTADHLWEVSSLYDRKIGRTRTMTLQQIMDQGFHYDSGPAKWAVALPEPAQFDDMGPLPLHPYLLGLLIGDGAIGHPAIELAAHADDADETTRIIAPMLPENVQLKRSDVGNWTRFAFPRVKGTDKENALSAILRDLGLWKSNSRTKFLPEAYLHADVMDRVALLQGLIDSDGHIDKKQRNTVTYTTSSLTLAENVVELVGSLGGVAKFRREKNRDTYTVTVAKLPEWIIPCRLRRKADHYQPPSFRSGRYRYMVSAEPVRQDQAQCISVDVWDSLYVTDGYVLTHNTPNMVVTLPKELGREEAERFAEMFRERNEGAANAYRTLFLGGGADATVVGSNLQQIDFRSTAGADETIIAAAAGVPATIVGISEGLAGSSLNAGNFAQAQRRFVDGTMRPLWRSAAASLSSIIRVPAGAELTYDARDIAFLRQDEKDEADIRVSESTAIRQLVDAGFNPDAVIDAVTTGDLASLVGTHSGLFSVQLQKPGAGQTDTPARNLRVETDERGYPLRLVEER